VRIDRPCHIGFDAENAMFQARPMSWFFITIALVTWLPVTLLMRLLVQRGRVSTPANAVCAAGRLALM
jgi:hypothetical protein